MQPIISDFGLKVPIAQEVSKLTPFTCLLNLDFIELISAPQK